MANFGNVEKKPYICELFCTKCTVPSLGTTINLDKKQKMSRKIDINHERGCVFSLDETTHEVTTTLTHGGFKLNTNDWIEKLQPSKINKIVEVRFKNTRKGYYDNVNELPIKVGDIVAVEGNPGHDIGVVSMSEDMVRKHMRCKRFSPRDLEFKKVYRFAKPYDIERWQEAISLEHATMIKSRQIAAQLELNMKIGDVEYQGDRIKAIFYYIADERVDFRELIKILADEFKIRIEMKQIGARQEAGRIGGIGSCGRDLCCSSFITNFVSVTTNSARFQDILLTPQKLAGQCGKLKCCLNFEVDSYIDARKDIPRVNTPLQTINGEYYLVKTDIFKGKMTFSTDPHLFVNTKVLSADTVREIISMNKRGIKAEELINEEIISDNEESVGYKNVIGDDSITRFDKKIVKKNKKRNNRPARKPSGEAGGNPRRANSEAGTNPRRSNAEAGGNPRRANNENSGNPRRGNDQRAKGDGQQQERKPQQAPKERQAAQPKGEGAEGTNKPRRYNNNRRQGPRRPNNNPNGTKKSEE